MSEKKEALKTFRELHNEAVEKRRSMMSEAEIKKEVYQEIIAHLDDVYDIITLNQLKEIKNRVYNYLLLIGD